MPADRRYLGRRSDGERSRSQEVLGKDTDRSAHGSSKSEPVDTNAESTPSAENSVQLFCTGLPYSWDREDLLQLFEPWRHVISVKVPHYHKMRDGN